MTFANPDRKTQIFEQNRLLERNAELVSALVEIDKIIRTLERTKDFPDLRIIWSIAREALQHEFLAPIEKSTEYFEGQDELVKLLLKVGLDEVSMITIIHLISRKLEKNRASIDQQSTEKP